MKTTKFVTTLIAAVLVLTLAPLTVPVEAQGPDSARVRYLNGEGVLRGISAVSTEAQVLIRYTGTNANGGTVTVAAGGDITFSQGAVGSSAVDATMECDASIAATGARNGIYDLSTPAAACDTLGEVVDLINNQGTNWLAVIVHGQRTDATDNVFITLSEAAANNVDGLGLLVDGTTLFKATQAVLPFAATKMGFYVAGSCGTVRTCRTLKANPFEGLTPVLFALVGTTTYGSGTSTQQIHCEAVTHSIRTGSAVVTTISRAAGATTVETTWSPSSYGVSCPVGQKMLARVSNSAAMTAATLYIAGHVY